MPRALFLLLFMLVVSCATPPRPIVESVEMPQPSGWQSIATPADRQRIAELAERWASARAAVPPRSKSKMAAEHSLLDPAGALQLPSLPPGSYRCRLIRLGGRVGFASFAPDFCYVDGNESNLSFTKQTGVNLPGGWLYPDTNRRQVFLGTSRRGEVVAPPYGLDPTRDVAGVVERVAPFRWRLVLAKAGKGALLEVYELVPVLPQS